jgi:hypothetical protein
MVGVAPLGIVVVRVGPSTETEEVGLARLSFILRDINIL